MLCNHVGHGGICVSHGAPTSAAERLLDQPFTARAPAPVLRATTSRKYAQNASKMPNRDPKSRYLRNGAHIIDRLKSAILGRFRASRGCHGAQRHGTHEKP